MKAKLGAGVWDLLVCQECGASWTEQDVNLEWTDQPEPGEVSCPTCHSTKVVREERG